MVYLLHDVLSEDLRKEFMIHDYGNAAPNGAGDFWYNQKYDELMFPYLKELLEVCSSYINLSSMVGYEMHHNYSDYSTYHVDKDELLYTETGELRYPIISMVYYPLIQEMEGGIFYTGESFITPTTNSLIIFSSDLYHGVKPVTNGTRLSVGINPWNEIPRGYTND